MYDFIAVRAGTQDPIFKVVDIKLDTALRLFTRVLSLVAMDKCEIEIAVRPHA